MFYLCFPTFYHSCQSFLRRQPFVISLLYDKLFSKYPKSVPKYPKYIVFPSTDSKTTCYLRESAHSQDGTVHFLAVRRDLILTQTRIQTPVHWLYWHIIWLHIRYFHENYVPFKILILF